MAYLIAAASHVADNRPKQTSELKLTAFPVE